MPYTDEGKAVMLRALEGAISHLSLHDGRPPDGNELPYGIYRRKQIDLREPDDGAMKTVRRIEFDVPAEAVITHAGFWTRPIGGVLLAWAQAPMHNFKNLGMYVVDLAELDLNLDEKAE
jgi:hypothetical protein